MTTTTETTRTEMADRLAIRALVDAYAHCAHRRDADGQKSLFTEDTHFVVYMDGDGTEPTQQLNGREALTPVVASLRYHDTFVKLDSAWLFSERRLIVDWTETRASLP